MARTARRIALIHKLFGLVIGLQFLFWTASGLFFTLFPISTIHGDPYRPVIRHDALDPTAIRLDAAAAADIVGGDLVSAELRAFLDRPVWHIQTHTGRALVDAVDGRLRSPLSEADIDALIDRFEPTDRSLGTLTIVYQIQADPKREYAGQLPVWILEYEPGKQRIYIDAVSGEIAAVRTTKWRIFDVLWRFHILDVTGADEFDTWWMKLAAFLGLTSVLFGMALLVDRARKGRLFS